jgi:Tfp pilus assembly protein PilV
VQLIARRRHDRGVKDAGFTLIEILIVMTLLMVVMGILFSMLWQAQKSEMYSRGRTEALDSMRTALDRMTKDLRQAYNINGAPGPKSLDVDTYVNGAKVRVVYDMSGGNLTRSVNAGPPVIIQADLRNASIFTYTPDANVPTLVSVVFAVKPPNLPDTTLTLEAEVRFRNLRISV